MEPTFFFEHLPNDINNLFIERYFDKSDKQMLKNTNKFF